ncbi:TnsA-like heteromeric transposase endonuclease subunit [Streptomyces sp. NPDC001828]|uniref:TnsA-like heteromeric transposase endonuclease subunit n=1 Tax=Streptomyces sp. NPDC001828 TaxID=3364615 RepID=UPI0036D104BA
MAVPAGADFAGLYVELSYVDAVGERQIRPPVDCATARFEDVGPVFRWSRGERHFSGWYWAAMTGHHVGFESWLERDRLMLVDFDPRVAGIASQPFWLHWHDGLRERRDAPDYFVRRVDGSAVVIDVRADERIVPRPAARRHPACANRLRSTSRQDTTVPSPLNLRCGGLSQLPDCDQTLQE